MVSLGRSKGDPSSDVDSSGETDSTKYQKLDQKPSKKSFCIKSFGNVAFYVIFTLSVYISINTTNRVIDLEEKYKNVIILSDKVIKLEETLNNLVANVSRMKVVRYPITRPPSTTTTTTTKRSTTTPRPKWSLPGNEEDPSPDEFDAMMAAFVRGDHSMERRPKRDLSSSYRLTRRQQRQTGAQSPLSTENCLCPPGESYQKFHLSCGVEII